MIHPNPSWNTVGDFLKTHGSFYRNPQAHTILDDMNVVKGSQTFQVKGVYSAYATKVAEERPDDQSFFRVQKNDFKKAVSDITRNMCFQPILALEKGDYLVNVELKDGSAKVQALRGIEWNADGTSRAFSARNTDELTFKVPLIVGSFLVLNPWSNKFKTAFRLPAVFVKPVWSLYSSQKPQHVEEVLGDAILNYGALVPKEVEVVAELDPLWDINKMDLRNKDFIRTQISQFFEKRRQSEDRTFDSIEEMPEGFKEYLETFVE
jgi:hypothetical protein